MTCRYRTTLVAVFPARAASRLPRWARGGLPAVLPHTAVIRMLLLPFRRLCGWVAGCCTPPAAATHIPLLDVGKFMALVRAGLNEQPRCLSHMITLNALRAVPYVIQDKRGSCALRIWTEQ